MTPFEVVTQKMIDLYHRKNHDYGSSFAKSCDEFGLLSPIIRITDKLNRLKELTLNDRSTANVNESIEDTLLDMANYCAMSLVWLKTRNSCDLSSNN